jgi:hypothetical protein
MRQELKHARQLLAVVDKHGLVQRYGDLSRRGRNQLNVKTHEQVNHHKKHNIPAVANVARPWHRLAALHAIDQPAIETPLHEFVAAHTECQNVNHRPSRDEPEIRQKRTHKSFKLFILITDCCAAAQAPQRKVV